MSLSMDTDGNCVGTMTQAGGTAEFIGADGDFYLKGDEAFWRSNSDPAKADATVELVGDKWVNLGADAGGFSDLCDLDSMIDDLRRRCDDAGKEFTKGDETTVDGENAVEVITKEGEETTTALVATEGEHYILEVTNEGGDEPGSFTLSEFNEPVDAEAPDEADVVELPRVIDRRLRWDHVSSAIGFEDEAVRRGCPAGRGARAPGRVLVGASGGGRVSLDRARPVAPHLGVHGLRGRASSGRPGGATRPGGAPAYPVRARVRRGRRLPEPCAREGAVAGCRRRRLRAHRAGSTGDRSPGGRDQGGCRGRRRKVPAASHARPARPPA